MKNALRLALCLCATCMVFVLSMPSAVAEDVKPVPVEDLKRACQSQGMRVDDNHGVEAEGLVGGFMMHLRTGEGTWHIPVVEFATEDTARARYDSGLATTLMGTIVTPSTKTPIFRLANRIR